jgi:hypothetical protein
VITQTDDYANGTRAVVYGFNEEEAAEIAEAAADAERAQQEANRERSIRHFLHDTCGNSSTQATDDEDYSNTGGAVVITPEMTVVDSGSEQPEPPQESGFSLQVGHVGAVDWPESIAPSPWSSTWAQARAEAEQRRAEEERFSWMRDADLQMLSMGLEPVPWDDFAEAVNQTGEYQFQAVEQRTCSEQVLQTGEPPGPDSLVGATLFVRSHTIVTALKMVIYRWNAPGGQREC